jgi:hypothetical protein
MDGRKQGCNTKQRKKLVKDSEWIKNNGKWDSEDMTDVRKPVHIYTHTCKLTNLHT